MDQDRPLQLRGLFPIEPLEIAPEPVRSPQEIEDRRGEARRISKRLLAIIADHHRSAEHLSVAMDRDFLLEVIDALFAESERKDPAPFLNDADEVRSYLKRALYEELLEEPSNVLFTVQVSPDVMRYEAMEVEFWRECLAQLKAKLT